MRYFPIFLDLADRLVVVIGGGEEALRKVRLLGKTGARIAVVAEALHDELAADPRVDWFARDFAPELLDGAALAISASPALDAAVAAAARARGIPVNAVDRPELSSFIVPSIVDRSPLVVAIGTEGAAPVLAQGLRARIDALLPHALGLLTEAAAQLRERAAAAIPPGSRRRSFWQRFFFGDVRDAFVAGDTLSFQAGVESLLAQESPPAIGRVSFIGLASDDPELLTLKAHRKLQEADLIVHDRTVAAAILEMARRDAVRLGVQGTLFDGTDAVLIREAKRGLHVVRLSKGAPSLEETVAVAAEGIAIEAESTVARGDGPLPAELMRAAS
jgi:uroporphyrin-III C-methyltransferase/precorrin-2 dehydrogenase/sirohydrochlorin ferrochelatase